MPVVAPPVKNGAVLVDEGRVIAVGTRHALDAPHARHVDLADAILLPGLINAHAHLELTSLRGLVAVKPFPRWVGTIRRVKELLGSGDYRAASRWGVLEHFAAGVTTIGDTGSSMEPARAMAELGARGVAFHEVFGPDPAQAASSMEGLHRALDDLSACSSERLAIGVSPHAPYTVSAELLRRVGDHAAASSLNVAMHVAESPEETAFVRDGAGPFAENLRRRGITVSPRRLSPVRWALEHGLGEVEPLLIHCVHTDAADLEAISLAAGSIAHCPWSNEALGVGTAPLASFLDHEITTGIGTDSVAAGREIDLFAELRAAAPLAPLGAGRLLALATVDAARALGVSDAGLIEPGAWADLCAVALGDVDDPIAAIVRRARAADVTHTWVAGRLVYERGSWPGIDAAAERAALAVAENNARRAVG